MKRVTLLVALWISIALGEPYEGFPLSKLENGSFLEQFDYTNLQLSGWIKSNATKFDEGRSEVMEYSGEWTLEPAIKYPVISGEKGLVLKSRAAHHAISKHLPVKFDNFDQDLVLQYEITLQNGFECGGAYIKLLDWQNDNYTDFSVNTPFQIMFGPDVCGANNKVQFILTRESPVTGKSEAKHLTDPPIARINDVTALYTLIIKKNQDYEIRINGKVAKAGSLLEEDVFSPPLNPPRKIDDENDYKPWLWDDRKYIPDPERLGKPDDYDEKYANHEIPDPNATIPEDWLESEPIYIDDPEAEPGSKTKILNPKCLNVSGCGPWTAPMVNNDDYKGPWIQPTIENPNYEGEWQPRKVANPEYYEDTNPSNLKPIGGVGFELWSMNKNILFNNIYLGHSIEEAESIGNSTWKVKIDLQDKQKKYHANIKNQPYSPPPDFEQLLKGDGSSFVERIVSFLHLVLNYQYQQISQFWNSFVNDPFMTIETYPYKFIVYNLLLITVISMLIGFISIIICFFANPDNVPEAEEDEEDKDEEISKDDENIEALADYFDNEGVSVNSFQSITKRK